MATYKNITIPKRGGGTRTQRVQVLASGKYRFVKNLKTPKTKGKTKSVKRMARRRYTRKKSRRSGKMTIPLAPVIGLVAGMAEPVQLMASGRIPDGIEILTARYTGYSIKGKRFNLEWLKNGLVPLIAGLLVHKFVGGTLGLNRILGRSKVPLIRL